MYCSMADWYLKAGQEGESEQSRLARILDLAQDLKVIINSRGIARM